MKKIYNLLILLALPITLILFSYSNGSPGGKTGSMGDGSNTCTDCHTGSATTQTGWITTDIPIEGYVAGETYTIVATGTHNGVVKFGFELTAEDELGTKTGTFVITEASRTKLANNDASVTHISGGTTPTGDLCNWTMNWTAPDPAPAAVRFNAAFNAANGNGQTSGDIIYRSVLTVQEFVAWPQITSVDPSHAQQGFDGIITITGENNTWSQGVSEIRFVLHNDPTRVLVGMDINVVNDNQVTCNLSIPIDYDIGIYDVYVDNVMLMNGFTVDILDDIFNNEQNQILALYPNPAVSNVNISTPVGSEIAIFDISGRLLESMVSTNSLTNIDVTTYQKGIYIVQTNYNGQKFTKKLTVK